MVHLFSRGTTQAMNSLINKKSIIISLNIPKIIFPLSSFLTNLYMIGIEFVIFFLFIAILGVEISSTIFLLPAIVFLLIIFTVGMDLYYSSFLENRRSSTKCFSSFPIESFSSNNGNGSSSNFESHYSKLGGCYLFSCYFFCNACGGLDSV